MLYQTLTYESIFIGLNWTASAFTAACGCAPGHAGRDPVSSTILDSRFRGNDGFDVYYCSRNNNRRFHATCCGKTQL